MTAKNYFFGASAGAAAGAAAAGAAAGAAASAGFASAAGAAGAAAAGAGAGAAASSFLPQAAKAAAAMIAAKTRDLFMMIFLNRGDKNNFRKLSEQLAKCLQNSSDRAKALELFHLSLGL